MNKKEAALTDWQVLPEEGNPFSAMIPMPADAKGSSYGACGVRIDGTPEFIDLVLGRLKGFWDGENRITQLHLTRQPVKPTEIGGQERTYDNAAPAAEVCYRRLHARPRLMRPTREFLRREDSDPTIRYCRLKGIDPNSLGDN